MRQIKFRGQALETTGFPGSISKGTWVYGSLWHDTRNSTCHIWDETAQYWVWVDICTVGQFTGFFDKTGREIYEEDIVRFTPNPQGSHRNDPPQTRWIQWIQQECAFCLSGEQLSDPPLSPEIRKYEVIGNIYENHDLLETIKKSHS